MAAMLAPTRESRYDPATARIEILEVGLEKKLAASTKTARTGS